MLNENKRTHCSFENFKSNICHTLKRLGDIEFLYTILKSNEVKFYWEKGLHVEALYLLAMIDYISRINNIPLCTNYDELRKLKFDKIIYPSGVYSQYLVFDDESILSKSYDESIPEFKRFNIVENEVRNIV